MARTVEGRLLTEAQRRAQIALSASSMVQARAVTRSLLDVDRLDASFPVWMTAMDHLALQGFMDSANIAAPYVLQFAEVEAGEHPELARVSFDHQQFFEDMRVNGPSNIKQKISRGVPPEKAKQAAVSRITGLAQEHVLAGGRGMVIGTVKYSGRGGRWRRVTDGKPCVFCAMLAARGPVYAADTVDFRAHHTCGCGVEQVFGEWEPAELEAQWQGAYAKAAGVADAHHLPRTAPAPGSNAEDNILWRMRRAEPDLFSDGVRDPDFDWLKKARL